MEMNLKLSQMGPTWLMVVVNNFLDNRGMFENWRSLYRGFLKIDGMWDIAHASQSLPFFCIKPRHLMEKDGYDWDEDDDEDHDEDHHKDHDDDHDDDHHDDKDDHDDHDREDHDEDDHEKEDHDEDHDEDHVDHDDNDTRPPKYFEPTCFNDFME